MIVMITGGLLAGPQYIREVLPTKHHHHDLDKMFVFIVARVRSHVVYYYNISYDIFMFAFCLSI